jgi:hypothetical protein
MTKFNNDQVTTAIWFLAGVAIAAASLGYGLGTLASPGSGFITFLAGMAMCFFSLIGLVEATGRRRKGTGWKPVLAKVMWGKSLIVFGFLGAYALLLPFLGFLLCTALFMGFLLRVIVPQTWAVIVVGGILTALGAYGIFEIWLEAQLPKGFLGF